MVWLGGLCARASLTTHRTGRSIGLAGPFQGIARAGKLDDVRSHTANAKKLAMSF
jgi:hypothetical protein